MNHKITLVTVCYNSVSTIRDTIMSVISQKYDEIEYIVVDGGSTDGTIGIINEFADFISMFICEPDNGLYDAMNKGIRSATGEVIGFINSDDLFCHQYCVSEIMTYFNNNSSIEGLFGGVKFFDSKPALAKRFYKATQFRKWMIRYGMMPPHPGMYLRSTTYCDVGEYDTNYRIAGDFDFIVRFFKYHKKEVVYCDKVWINMRNGGVSTSGLLSYYTSSIEMLGSLRNNGVNSNLFFILLRLPYKFVRQVLIKKIYTGFK